MKSVCEDSSSERRITNGQGNHILTNVGVWSHDSRWIYYDVRSDIDGTVFDSNRVERIDTRTGETEVVFQATKGSHVGVVTANPVRDEIVFIHGPDRIQEPNRIQAPDQRHPETPAECWQYSVCHRRGVVVSPGNPNAKNLDARDLTPPFTPGALRGGSHVHVFSGDGNWVSFTYEDHILENANKAVSDITKELPAQANQRNVGVASPVRSVDVPDTHPRNHPGSHFSVLVTQTSDHPIPGTDEINRAYSDAWIGVDGYLRNDGTRQKRALAFIGDCLDASGIPLSELYVVDFPDDITVPADRPLAGTSTTRPSPPRGTQQRRLTFTADRRHPGLASGDVRHWPRSSPDGSQIAFLMKDDLGRNQIWTISPTGEAFRQLTRGEAPVQSAFTFRCDGLAIACVIGGRICEVDVIDGTLTALTRSPNAPGKHTISDKAVVYSPNGKQIAYTRIITDTGKPRNQIYLVSTV